MKFSLLAFLVSRCVSVNELEYLQMYVGPYYSKKDDIRGGEISVLGRLPLLHRDMSAINLHLGPVVGGGTGRHEKSAKFNELYYEAEAALSICGFVVCMAVIGGTGKIERQYETERTIEKEHTISGFVLLPILFYTRVIEGPTRKIEHGIMIKYPLFRENGQPPWR